MNHLATTVALVATSVGSFPTNATARAGKVGLPSAGEVGRAIAFDQRCVDPDGYTQCLPEQPVGATFRQLLCVEYGSDSRNRPVVRCVYKGGTMKIRGLRRSFERAIGDGAIDLTNMNGTWLP